MSYTKLYYHIIIRTYRNAYSIDEAHEKELYSYMNGFISNQNAKLIRIGGRPNHIHLLVSLPSTIAISSFVQNLKVSTSKWLKTNPNFPLFNRWSKEFAAFTISKQESAHLILYIMGQKEHHRVKTFAEEYRSFLVENGLEIREEYFLKD